MRPRFAVLRCRDRGSLTHQRVARGAPRGHSHRREGRGEQFAATGAPLDGWHVVPCPAPSPVLDCPAWSSRAFLVGRWRRRQRTAESVHPRLRRWPNLPLSCGPIVHATAAVDVEADRQVALPRYYCNYFKWS